MQIITSIKLTRNTLELSDYFWLNKIHHPRKTRKYFQLEFSNQNMHKELRASFCVSHLLNWFSQRQKWLAVIGDRSTRLQVTSRVLNTTMLAPTTYKWHYMNPLVSLWSPLSGTCGQIHWKEPTALLQSLCQVNVRQGYVWVLSCQHWKPTVASLNRKVFILFGFGLQI